jgi:hypothetical protein
VSKKQRRGPGMTLSRGGVPPKVATKGRKNRKHYPTSWGCAPDQMKMKKRVLTVFDGPRRLWKDEMMIDSEFEVRMHLGPPAGSAADAESSDLARRENPQYYITDLDFATVNRANALHDATEEEKGPWIEGADSGEIERLMLG